MAGSLPEPDIARFARIDPRLLVQSYLSTVKRGLSLPKLRNGLKSLLTPVEVSKAADALVANGTITEEKGKLRDLQVRESTTSARAWDATPVNRGTKY